MNDMRDAAPLPNMSLLCMSTGAPKRNAKVTEHVVDPELQVVGPIQPPGSDFMKEKRNSGALDNLQPNEELLQRQAQTFILC